MTTHTWACYCMYHSEVGDGGDSTSDGSNVESGGRRRSDGHHSGSDVCAGEEGMAPSLAEFDVLRFRNSFLKVRSIVSCETRFLFREKSTFEFSQDSKLGLVQRPLPSEPLGLWNWSRR